MRDMRDESQLYDAYVSDTPARASVWKAALSAAGAVGLLAAVVAWSYTLGVRDAGDVPVIRALAGDARVAPDDPGGVSAEHQGRTVYALLAGEEAAQAAPPPAAVAAGPEPLTAEDRAPAQESASTPAPVSPELKTVIDSLIDEVLSAGPAPPAPPPGVPYPKRRPALGAASVRTEAAPAPAPQIPIAQAPVGAAVAQVQLGAYLSEETALRMWRAIAGRQPALLGGFSPVVDPTSGGVRVLHRLRVRPVEGQASALCAALRTAGEECVVVGAG